MVGRDISFSYFTTVVKVLYVVNRGIVGLEDGWFSNCVFVFCPLSCF